MATEIPWEYQMAGIFRATDGSAAVFREYRLGGPIWLAPHPGGTARLEAPTPTPGETLLGSIAAFDALWLPEEDATGWSSFMVDKPGVARSVHLTRAGVIDAEHTLQDLGGVLGLTVNSAGRHLLRSQVNGTIERLTWDQDGIRRTPLASVTLPKGQVMAGAVENGQHLLVFTLAGFKGTDVQFSHEGGQGCELGCKVGNIQPELGRVLLWQADLPVRP